MARAQPPRYPELLESIAANVRRLREKRGWSQARLAEEIDVAERYVQKIEAGKVNLGVTTLVALADALDVTPGRLLRTATRPPTKVGRPRSRR